MTEVRKALRQRGVSPKLIVDLLTSVAAFLVTYYGISLDPELSVVISKGIGFLAGWIVGPGTVEVEGPPEGKTPPGTSPNMEF